jgi:hypothetical protein
MQRELLVMVSLQIQRKHYKLVKNTMQFIINRIDAGENSNFSTDAQCRWKLGSQSADASERGAVVPLSFFK